VARPLIYVFPDREALSRKAAGLFAGWAEKAIKEKGSFSVALSGGSTPLRLYSLLAGEEYGERVPWRRVHVFFGDERAVGPESGQSNFKHAQDRLLSVVPADVHRIEGERDPREAAERYEQVLREHLLKAGRLDLVLLGAGEDGHTASLFPASRTLQEEERLVLPVYDVELPRVTMTLPVINGAARVLFLVAGRAKADIVYDILETEDLRRKYPAGLVEPRDGELVWLLDGEAAAKLRRTDTRTT
jgi:6-phosphogluconolactonase